MVLRNPVERKARGLFQPKKIKLPFVSIEKLYKKSTRTVALVSTATKIAATDFDEFSDFLPQSKIASAVSHSSAPPYICIIIHIYSKLVHLFYFEFYNQGMSQCLFESAPHQSEILLRSACMLQLQLIVHPCT
jgi:hypothetical protein